MEQSFVVTDVAAEKKGERLVVLHKLTDADLKTCLDALAKSALPNLWRPGPDQFIRVPTFPHLGSGKLDLCQSARDCRTGLQSKANRLSLTQRMMLPLLHLGSVQSYAGNHCP